MNIKNLFFLFFVFIHSSNLYAEIFYIDIDKIINQTIVGKYINEEIQKSRKTNETKILEKKNELKKREENLITKKNILEPSEFNDKLKLFKRDVSEFNELSQRSSRDLQNKLMKNKANFLKLIEPIILDYVATKNITYLLQKQYIIVGHNNLNKTKDIIELVDKKINISNFNESISK